MNNTYQSILSIVRNYLVNDNDVLIFDNLDELIDMSNKLAISPIISCVLKENGYEQFDAPLLISFRNYKLQESLKEKLTELFESKSINFMYIKGSSLSKYYKDPFLRIGSDIDVVVENKDYKKAKKVLKDEGYKVEMDVDSECHLTSPSGVVIDLHNCFIETSNILNNYLLTKFNKNHELSIEDTYLLLVVHSVKHFKRGVIDLKVFTDLFYIRDKIIDWSSVDEVLKELNLLTYKETLNRYLDYIIGMNELDPILNTLEEYIIDRNNFDVFKNHIIGKIARDGLLDNNNKLTLFSYIHTRIFISKERMYQQFPNSKKYKVLLPFYYLYRPIYMLTRTGFKINELISEISAVYNMKDDKLNRYLDLYKKMGLYNHIDK